MELNTFNALAEPNRFRIVNLLLKGSLTVGEIAERLDIQRPQASKHLKVFAGSRLGRGKGGGEPAKLQARSEPFQELDRWLDNYRAYGTNGLTTWMTTWRSCNRI